MAESDIPQHVIQRGNNREPCFHGEEDCQRYLAVLGDAALATVAGSTPLS
jgi:putative transposase